MSQRSRFFDSVDGDRIYSAAAWAQVFSKFVRSGYIAADETGADKLEVTPSSPEAMTIEVQTGSAWLEGRFFEVYDSVEVLPVSANATGSTRIDLVVVRLDLDARDIYLDIKEDVSDPPMVGDLQRDDTIYEIAPFAITVADGEIQIGDAELIDLRDTDLCPPARGPLAHGNLYYGTEAERDTAVGQGLISENDYWWNEDVSTVQRYNGATWDPATPEPTPAGLVLEAYHDVEETNNTAANVDLITFSGLAIPASKPLRIMVAARKVAGSATYWPLVGIKINGVEVISPVQVGINNANAGDGLLIVEIGPAGTSNYGMAVATGYWPSSKQETLTGSGASLRRPSAEVNTITIFGRLSSTGSGHNMAVRDAMVYSYSDGS